MGDAAAEWAPGGAQEWRTTMANGNVVIYFSRFGKPLQTHHKVVLDLAAKTIAKIKGYDFGGNYDPARDYRQSLPSARRCDGRFSGGRSRGGPNAPIHDRDATKPGASKNLADPARFGGACHPA